jgi:hypothetical protein
MVRYRSITAFGGVGLSGLNYIKGVLCQGYNPLYRAG